MRWNGQGNYLSHISLRIINKSPAPADYFPTGMSAIRTEQAQMTDSPFKIQVASEAVQKAARKKRKNPDGRVFGCRYCGANLTTKMNLNYK
jgi:hypothetical protein